MQIAAGQLDARAKSIKFVDLPNPEQLCKQVETVTSWLEWLCSQEKELDLMLMASESTSAADLMAPSTVEARAVGAMPWRPPAMNELSPVAA